MTSMKITHVWNHNFEQQIGLMCSYLSTHRNACIDTEFPRLLVNTPRDAHDLERYEHVRLNVLASILFQVGITLTDDEGQIAGTWQFNLYDKRRMEYISREYGTRFGYVPEYGIPLATFAKGFGQVLRDYYGKVRWVTFHGLYDIANLIALVIGHSLLPYLLSDFMTLVDDYFGKVYDIKTMLEYLVKMQPCYESMFGKPNYVGLEKLAMMLGVKREGKAHQAGSDSLVTACVLSKITKIHGLEEAWKHEDEISPFEGVLYGISTPAYCYRRVAYPMINRKNPIKMAIRCDDTILNLSLDMASLALQTY